MRERYSLLRTFIKWGKEEIVKQNKKWRETKVERSKDPIKTLENICNILDSRYVGHHSIDIAIKFLKSSFSLDKNKEAVNFVKDKIISSVEQLCDCVDQLDYDEMEEKLNFLYDKPKRLHEHAGYELEKTFMYLDDERGECLPGSNEEWGLIQAKNFYESYSKKYVYINFKEMSYLDIKILITASLIIGKEHENS